jgi:FkbM family methyltransferase
VKNLIQKVNTALSLAANPSFFKNYRSGIIPYTYCQLNQPWFRAMQIDTLLDIGANVGRFSTTIHALIPDIKIFAFEPLPDCYKKTVESLKRVPTAKVFNCGLGNAEATIDIFANDFSPSSSFLPMGKTHLEAFPSTHQQKKIKVQVRRLDDMRQELDIDLKANTMVKIDVQGYERDVLNGGLKTIAQAKFVLIEVSYEELYDNQPLFADVFDIMRSLGFTFAGTMTQMKHPGDGRFLDADCFFVRAS